MDVGVRVGAGAGVHVCASARLRGNGGRLVGWVGWVGLGGVTVAWEGARAREGRT